MQTQLKDKQAKEDKQQQDSEECFEYVKQDANERKSCRRKRFHWSEPKEVPKWEPHMFGLEEEKREEKEGEVQPRQEEDELVVDIRTR